MLAAPDLLLFSGAALVLLLSPGPAVLYIVARTIDQGKRAGWVSTLAMTSGGLVHVCATAFGLSALLAASPTSFQAITFAGALYLVYLGVRRWGTAAIATAEMPPNTLWRIFREGFWVQVFNPKTALFFLSFLPQFAAPETGSVVVQLLGLGGLFLLLALCTDGLYVLLADRVRDWLPQHPHIVRLQRYFAGAVYIALALLTLW